MTLQVKKNYFLYNLRILLWLGVDILPIESKIIKFFFHFYQCITIGMGVFFLALTEGMDLVLNFVDLYKMTFGLSYLITHILGSAKVAILIVKRKSLWNLLQKLEDGVFLPNMERGGEHEYNIINSAIKKCNNQGTTFYVLVILIISFRSIYAANNSGTDEYYFDKETNVTVLKHITTMPFASWFPFNINKKPGYQIGFLYQVVTTVAYGVYIGAADAIICGMMMHIKAQFLILKHSLETVIDRAKKNISKDDDPNVVFDMSYKNLRLPKGVNAGTRLSVKVQNEVEKLVAKCVYHHQELIYLCDAVEEEFRYLMLMQFLSSVIILCFQLFQLSLTSPASPEFVSMVFYLCLMMFQILCYCWHGNEVMIVSSDLPSFIFQIDWILLNNSTKKALLLMMMRAQRPMQFTAGKFALLSLETYMTIVRGSGSYFMVLNQMNN